jgi:uncharacterized phage protein (TIGR02218 family)
MKTVNANLLTHLASEVTTLAIMWKMTTSSNLVYGFTSHTSDITFNGVLYRSAQGFTPTTIQTSSGLGVDNLDMKGLLAALGIHEKDVNDGIFDGASLEVFLINYADLTMGDLKLRKGFLGNVKLNRVGFEAEVRGLMERFQRTILEVYTPGCRADLGDARCTVNLASFTVTGSITSFTNRRTFRDTTRTEADGYFMGGLLTWTSGDNNGLKMEVKRYTSATDEFELCLPMRNALVVGDTYSVFAGCDKQWETCKTKFNNIVNFRGEPFVPQEQSVALSAIR